MVFRICQVLRIVGVSADGVGGLRFAGFRRQRRRRRGAGASEMSRRLLDRDLGPIVWPAIWLMGTVSMIVAGSPSAAILLLPVLPWFGYRYYRVFLMQSASASGERDSAPPASGVGGKIALNGGTRGSKGVALAVTDKGLMLV